MDPRDDIIARAAAGLSGGQPQRVWSLIVTLFGDLARAPGDSISGAALSRITDLAGVRPEAMRVALHRLRKDGWIESERRGRSSIHRLTRSGREQSEVASPGIYARVPPTPADWHVLLAGDTASRAALADLLLAQDYVELFPDVAIGPGPVPAHADELLAFGPAAVPVPGWVRRRICPPALEQAGHALHAALGELSEQLAQAPQPGPGATAALRTLVVHNWRRLILRHPDLPAGIFPETWAVPACRQRVHDVLGRLPRPELAAIEADLAPTSQPTPGPTLVGKYPGG